MTRNCKYIVTYFTNAGEQKKMSLFGPEDMTDFEVINLSNKLGRPNDGIVTYIQDFPYPEDEVEQV